MPGATDRQAHACDSSPSMLMGTSGPGPGTVPAARTIPSGSGSLPLTSGVKNSSLSFDTWVERAESPRSVDAASGGAVFRSGGLLGGAALSGGSLRGGVSGGSSVTDGMSTGGSREVGCSGPAGVSSGAGTLPAGSACFPGSSAGSLQPVSTLPWSIGSAELLPDLGSPGEPSVSAGAAEGSAGCGEGWEGGAGGTSSDGTSSSGGTLSGGLDRMLG